MSYLVPLLLQLTFVCLVDCVPDLELVRMLLGQFVQLCTQ